VHGFRGASQPCSGEQIELPLGFGSRHLAAASISQRLGVVAIVVSESGVVRVFHGGQIEATLIPELWLLDRHHTQLSMAAAGTVEAQRLGAATHSRSTGKKNLEYSNAHVKRPR
jgi:hypothetical protein